MRVAAILLALALGSSTAFAQGGILVQGIADLEGWSTDTMSTLLRRNRGSPGALARLLLWSAAEPLPRLVFYAQADLEARRFARDARYFFERVGFLEDGTRMVRRVRR